MTTPKEAKAMNDVTLDAVAKAIAAEAGAIWPQDAARYRRYASAALTAARAEAEAKDAIIHQQAENAAKAAKEYADNMEAARAETAALVKRVDALDAEVGRLCEVICAVAEAREAQDFEALLAAIADAEAEAVLSAEQRARQALASEPGK